MTRARALQRQGAALLGLVAVLALAITALFIAGLERSHSAARERLRNGQVLQLARQALTLRPGLKVLFTSGYAEGAMDGGLPGGLAGNLLSKPYRREELARKLREVLETKEGSG